MAYWIELRRLALLVAIALLAACASKPDRGSDAAVDDELEPAYPPDAIEAYSYAIGLMDAGQIDEATAAMQQLADQYPDYGGPLTNLAILSADGGDDETAAEYLQQALAVCDHCAAAWNQMGILHRRAGRFGDAEQAYLAAVDSDPRYALAHYNLGVLYDLYQQRHELALEHYERYVALSADSEGAEQVGMWIADLRRRLGEHPRTARIDGEL